MSEPLPAPLNSQSAVIKDLMGFDRWVCWRYVEKDGNFTKPPFRIFSPGSMASVSDVKSWSSSGEAFAHAQKTGDGVGFVLSPADDDLNLVAFDLDYCRDPETGELANWARLLVEEADSYTEVTPSQKGLRIIGKGTNEKLHTKLQRPNGGQIEIYSRANRYITITGERLEGTPDKLSDLSRLVSHHKGEREERNHPNQSEQPTKTPIPINKLCPELRALVERGTDKSDLRIPEGKRSEAFHHAVGWLKDNGFSVDDVTAYMCQYPTGIVEKYANRIEQEVRRCFDKCESKSQPPIEDFNADVKLFTIGELLNRPLPEFLIDKMLPEKGVAIIAGHSGVMKTFLMIELGLAAATGRNLDKIHVKRTGVLFLNNEGQAGFAQRCLAALTHHGMKEPDNFRVAEVSPDLMQGGSLGPFIEAIAELNYTPGLIVIDTFSKATIGGDDNSTSDMATAIQTANKLATRFDALVVLIDHVGKDAKKGLRGAYSKYANADMVGLVTKLSNTVTLKTVKQKEAEDGVIFDFMVSLTKITDQTTGDEREVPALSFRPEPYTPTQKEFIVRLLEHSGTMERKALATAFDQMFGPDKKGSFTTQYNRLRKTGKIEEDSGYVSLVE